MADDNVVEIALKINAEQFEKGVRNARVLFVDSSFAIEKGAKPASAAIDKLSKEVGELNIESGKASFAVKQLNRSKLSSVAASKKASAAEKRLSVQTALTADANKKTAASTSLLANKVIALGAAYLTVTNSVRLLQTLLKTGGNFEALRVQLDTLTGSSEAGEKAFEWINTFVKETPFGLEDVTKGFVKLKAFGLDPIDGTYQAIADQAAALGGGQEKLNGIILAVGQAWAKQKLQGEEILQLVERGVPVWDLLAKATGKNALELQKLSEQGKLGRNVIAQLVEEMGKGVKGAALDQVKTWNGLVSNAQVEWQKFLDTIAQSGSLDFFKQELTELLEEVERLAESGELQQYAQEVSEAVIGTVKAIGSFVSLVVGLSDEIKLLIEVLIVTKILAWAKAMFLVAAGTTAAAKATKLLKATVTLGLTLVLDAIISKYLAVDDAANDAADGVKKSAEEIKKAQQKIREEANKKIDNKAQSALKEAAKQHADFALKLKNAKEAETKVVETELAKQLTAYKKHLEGLKRAQEQQIDIAKEFANFVREINQGAKSETDEPDILDFATTLTNARKLLKEGDYDGAIDGARGLADMIRTMRDNGTEADIVLSGLAQQAEKLANDAASKQVEKEGEKLKQAEDSIDSLVSKAEFLKHIELGFDEQLAERNMQQIQNILQQQLIKNPLIMSVQMATGPDLKGAQKLLEAVSANSSQFVPEVPELPADTTPIRRTVELDTEAAERKLDDLSKKAAAPVTKKVFISADGTSFSDRPAGVNETVAREARKKGSR